VVEESGKAVEVAGGIYPTRPVEVCYGSMMMDNMCAERRAKAEAEEGGGGGWREGAQSMSVVLI
jgi:hypothetical protein